MTPRDLADTTGENQLYAEDLSGDLFEPDNYSRVRLPRDEASTAVDAGYCFPAATVERDDFEERAARYFRRRDQVNDEDDWITEHQQTGVAGSGPGCYTPEEHVVHRLDNWILDRVLGADFAATAR